VASTAEGGRRSRLQTQALDIWCRWDWAHKAGLPTGWGEVARQLMDAGIASGLPSHEAERTVRDAGAYAVKTGMKAKAPATTASVALVVDHAWLAAWHRVILTWHPTTRAVADTILARMEANSRNRVVYARGHLAVDAGVSVSTVKRHTELLKEEGIFEVEPGKGQKATTFRLLAPPGETDHPDLFMRVGHEEGERDSHPLQGSGTWVVTSATPTTSAAPLGWGDDALAWGALGKNGRDVVAALADGDVRSASDLERRTGVPRSTVRAKLRILVECGAVVALDAGGYRLVSPVDVSDLVARACGTDGIGDERRGQVEAQRARRLRAQYDHVVADDADRPAPRCAEHRKTRGSGAHDAPWRPVPGTDQVAHEYTGELVSLDALRRAKHEAAVAG
jgi:DNA-binding transcriptional ArsR family regulator